MTDSVIDEFEEASYWGSGRERFSRKLTRAAKTNLHRAQTAYHARPRWQRELSREKGAKTNRKRHGKAEAGR